MNRSNRRKPVNHDRSGSQAAHATEAHRRRTRTKILLTLLLIAILAVISLGTIRNARPTGSLTSRCDLLSGGFGASFERHYDAPGGLDPTACGPVHARKPGDKFARRGTWIDNTSSYSGVPTNCIEQGKPPVPGAGHYAVRIHANAGTGGSLRQDCIWMSNWRYITYPADVYYGLMWYFPRVGYNDPSGGQHDEISEFNFHPFIQAGPLGYSLFGDTMQFYVNTGCWRRCSRCRAQYNNGARAENGTRGSNLGPVSTWRIVPKGDLYRGKWIETIVHVHYANDKTGAIQSWWRVKGQTRWNETINQTGFPTIAWGPDSGQKFKWSPSNENGVTTMDHLGVYRTSDKHAPDTTFWIDNWQRRTTFAAVARTMP